MLGAFGAPTLQPEPVHVVYGGAHLFGPESPSKLGGLALRALDAHAPTGAALAGALGLADAARADWLRERVVDRLQTEPIADQRIDFEDGFGARSDADEDEAARAAAAAMLEGLSRGSLAPRIGIRVRSMEDATSARALRTLGLFLQSVAEAGAALPSGFVVTLPKVSGAGEVAHLASALDRHEASLGFGRIDMEVLVETPAAIGSGAAEITRWIDAGAGRVRSVHLGPYDLLTSVGVPGDSADLHHPWCDAVRAQMLASVAGLGVSVCDGPTKTLPIGDAVVPGWRRHAADIRRSWSLGFARGWDLHPAQLVSRHATVIALADASFADACVRLRGFVEAAARASRVGARFDDASSARGLVRTVARAVWCGARTEHDVRAGVGIGLGTLLSTPIEALGAQ